MLTQASAKACRDLDTKRYALSVSIAGPPSVQRVSAPAGPELARGAEFRCWEALEAGGFNGRSTTATEAVGPLDGALQSGVTVSQVSARLPQLNRGIDEFRVCPVLVGVTFVDRRKKAMQAHGQLGHVIDALMPKRLKSVVHVRRLRFVARL